jgi:hypothetical protein
LSRLCYRYESMDGAFVAEIEVDDLGSVSNDAGLWRRVATVDAGDD